MNKKRVLIGLFLILIVWLAYCISYVHSFLAFQVFYDGFENDFNGQWLHYQTAGETNSTTNETSHHENYSAKFTSNGGGGTEYSVAYVGIGSRNYVYGNTYFNLTQNGIEDNRDLFYFTNLANIGFNRTLLGIGLEKWSNNLIWRILYYSGSSAFVSKLSTEIEIPTLNEWFSVSFYIRVDDTDGELCIWHNDEQIFHRYGYDSSYYGAIGYHVIGLSVLTNCSETVIYADCENITLTPIQLESEIDYDLEDAMGVGILGLCIGIFSFAMIIIWDKKRKN